MQFGKKMFMATTGSTLYGYRVQGSDRNFVAIAIPSPADIESGDVDGLSTLDNGKTGAERHATTIYSPSEFFRYVCAGNVDAVTAAFISGDCLQWEDENGKAVRAYAREHLITKYVVATIGAFVRHQREQLSEENFADGPFCRAIRGAVQATALAKFATFSPALKNPLKDTVWRVRRGRVTPSDAMALLDELITQMHVAIDTTTLDLEPDVAAREAFISALHAKLLIPTEG